MIPPIYYSHSTPNLQEINLTFVQAEPSTAFYFSTLQSEKCSRNVFICLGNFLKITLVKIFSFFFSLFSLLTCGYFSKNQNSLIVEKAVQNISKKIDRRDPFQNSLFELKNGSCLFKKPIHFQKAHHLFSILGTGGLFNWLYHQSTLYDLKKDILALDYIPFEFLLYIFMNQETTHYLTHLKESSSNRALNTTLKIAGHQHPWNTLLLEQSNRLAQYHQKNLKLCQTLIPGFCKLLELDIHQVQKLVQGKAWEKLILYIFEERVKSFK